ncbi:MAG: PAS domain-containing protein [Xanthobacteraceae bacterium]
MKHAASRELYAYWEEKRGTRPAPERAEIEPGAIRGVLSDAFILALDRSAGHPIRLAGTRVCALFDREIKGEAFVNLWSAASRPIIGSLLAILTDECTGTVAGVTAQNANGEPIELELLLLPLATRRPSFARAIGVLAPLKAPPWLGVSQIGALTLGGRRHVGAELEKRLLPRFMTPRLRRGLMVYEGGQGTAPANKPNNEDGPSAA